MIGNTRTAPGLRVKAKLDKRTGGYTPLMDVADENAYAEHRAYVENFIAGAFDNVLAA